MKKLTVILTIALLIVTLLSCDNLQEKESTAKLTTIRVLDKKYDCRGGCSYYIYIYDGESAKWYSTTQETFNSIDINDTLPTIVLKSYYIKK